MAKRTLRPLEDRDEAAFGDVTPQVVLSERQTRRPTTPGAHTWLPVLKKIADIWPVAPAGIAVKTDSPGYAES